MEATLLAAWKGRSGSYVVARVKDHEQCKFMGEVSWLSACASLASCKS